jgi:hypothetical protein
VKYFGGLLVVSLTVPLLAISTFAQSIVPVLNCKAAVSARSQMPRNLHFSLSVTNNRMSYQLRENEDVGGTMLAKVFRTSSINMGLPGTSEPESWIYLTQPSELRLQICARDNGLYTGILKVDSGVLRLPAGTPLQGPAACAVQAQNRN